MVQKYVIGGPVQSKPANDESLAHDEGGGRKRQWQLQDAKYKIVQGRQLRMTLAKATCFRLWMQLRAGPPTPKRSTREPTTLKLQEYHTTSCVSDQQT